MTPSLRFLLEAVVDYAGLFPPAQLDMAASVKNYSNYFRGPHAWALGRFIVPVSRLEEFNFQIGDLRTGAPGETWRMSALAGANFGEDIEHIKRFNRWHAERDELTRFVIDTVEVKADTPDSIAEHCSRSPDSLRVFFEVPAGGDPAALVRSISQLGGGAKLRTGGVTEGMVPPAESVVRFMDSCLRAGARFKVTAGLHHPVRGIRPLSYEPGAPKGMMYGFLNLLFCAAFVYDGMRPDAAVAILADESVDAFRFDDSGIEWRGNRLTIDAISAARRDFVVSFGSCSFEEPIEDLKRYGLL